MRLDETGDAVPLALRLILLGMLILNHVVVSVVAEIRQAVFQHLLFNVL